MKKVFSLVVSAFVFMFMMACGSFAHAGDVAAAAAAWEDIEILKLVNLFDLTKEQAQQLIPILEEGYQSRLKNLNEIRTAMLKGKKYGDLADTYRQKLDRTNAKIVGKLQGILNDTQKEKAQMVFDLITEDEMKTVLEAGPQILGMIQKRIGLLRDLGILNFSEDTMAQLMAPITQMALELVTQMQGKIREKVLGKICQPRAVELLKEKIAMPVEDKKEEKKDNKKK